MITILMTAELLEIEDRPRMPVPIAWMSVPVPTAELVRSKRARSTFQNLAAPKGRIA